MTFGRRKQLKVGPSSKKRSLADEFEARESTTCGTSCMTGQIGDAKTYCKICCLP